MKKTIKIFAIILTVCLLIGSIAVAASAADFDKHTVIRDSAFDDESTSVDGISNFRDFQNTFKFEKAREHSADGNGYTVIRDPDSSGKLTAATNAYLIGTTATGASVENVNLYDAFIVEYDLSAKNSFFDGMYIGVFTNVGSAYFDIGYTILDNGTWYYANASTLEAATAKVALPANVEEWTHFTLIAYDDANGARIDTYINGEYFATKTAKKTFRMERICIRFNNEYAYGPEFGRELRLDNFYSAGYGSASEPFVADDVFGLDDYIALGDKTLPLTFVEDIKFNSSYEFESPNTASATLGNGNYQNLAAAFKALENGDTVTLTKDLTLYTTLDESIKTLTFTGANVTLIGDAAKLYSLEGGVLTKNESYNVSWTDGTSTIYTENLSTDKAPDPATVVADFGIRGDYKDASKWNISIGGADNVILSELEWTAIEAGTEVVLSPRFGTVSWYELDGETADLENEKWFVGSEIEPRGFDTLEAFELLDNGWYEWGYGGWSNKDGSAADYSALTEGAHRDYVAAKTAVSSIDMKFNYTLGSQYRASLYLPAELPEVKVTEVKYTQASKVDGVYVPGKYEVAESAPAIIGGARYTRYNSSTLSIFSWYPVTRFIVSFDVTIGEGDAAVTYNVTSKDIDCALPTYLKTILNTYDCGTPEEILVLNWLKYISAQYAISENKPLQAADDIIAAHDETCVASSLYDLDAQLPTAPDESLTYKSIPEALGDGFAASYAIFGNNIRNAFYVPKEYADAHPDLKVQISLVGIKNGVKDQQIVIDLLPETEEIETEVEGSDPIVTVKNIEFTVNEVTCYRYIADADAMSMYNVNEIITISIIPGGEEASVSATYSIAEYLYNINAKLPAEPTADELYNVEGIKALIAFSKASKAYTSYSIDKNAQ